MSIRNTIPAAILAIGGLLHPLHAATFAKGADASWASQQEASGQTFKNDAGTTQDCFKVLAGEGINAIRLRVWVNPSGGWCNGADVLYKAKRAVAQGQRIMIDFHYSDTWADPTHQAKPAAWSGHTISQLYTDVYNHTYGILNYLKTNGVTAEWVQVGNETNSGMLFPEGGYAKPAQLAGLITSGYNAAKAVNSSTKVIVHLSNGYDNALYRWYFDLLKANGAKYDVIGMSHYPTVSNWSTRNSQILTNMKDMVSRYGKQVMVCEVGFDWQQATTAKSMLTDLITKTKTVSSALGVFYWEPQAYPGWQGYTFGAFDNAGKPTVAMNAFN